jgi:hypothetical protein
VYNTSVLYLQDEPIPSELPSIPVPSPTATSIEDVPPAALFGSDGYLIAAWTLGAVLILATAIIMVRSLIAAATRPPPSMLIISLSLLTLLAISGGVITNNDEAWTIAAAGVGALAGSVTSLFERYRPEDERESREDENSV